MFLPPSTNPHLTPLYRPQYHRHPPKGVIPEQRGKWQAEDSRINKAVKIVLRCNRVLGLPRKVRRDKKQTDVCPPARLTGPDRTGSGNAPADALPLQITQPQDVLESQIVGLQTISTEASSPPSLKSPPKLLVAKARTSAAPSSLSTGSSRGTTRTMFSKAEALGFETICLMAKCKQKDHRKSHKKSCRSFLGPPHGLGMVHTQEVEVSWGEEISLCHFEGGPTKHHVIGPSGEVIRRYVNRRGLTWGDPLREGSPPGEFFMLCCSALPSLWTPKRTIDHLAPSLGAMMMGSGDRSWWLPLDEQWSDRRPNRACCPSNSLGHRYVGPHCLSRSQLDLRIA